MFLSSETDPAFAEAFARAADLAADENYQGPHPLVEVLADQEISEVAPVVFELSSAMYGFFEPDGDLPLATILAQHTTALTSGFAMDTIDPHYELVYRLIAQDWKVTDDDTGYFDSEMMTEMGGVSLLVRISQALICMSLLAWACEGYPENGGGNLIRAAAGYFDLDGTYRVRGQFAE